MKPSRSVALIPVSQHFSIRYFLLSGILRNLSHDLDCTLVLGWEDPKLERDLRRMGFSCVRMPQFRPQPVYRQLRRWVNAAWESDMRSPTPAIDRRRVRAMESSLRGRLFLMRTGCRRRLAACAASPFWMRRALEHLEKRYFESETNWTDFARLIRNVNPEVIISATPFITEEAVLCRVGKAFGVKTIATVLSFDNLTSRGRWELTFDHYGVWNRFMRDEVMRIYRVPGEQVTVTGAPQFDFYAQPDILYPRERFLLDHELDGKRPVLLLAGGPPHISPLEPRIVLELDRRLSRQPLQRRPQILVRPHPVDSAGRWNPCLRACNNVRFAPAWRVHGFNAGSIGMEDVRALATALAHTDVHISTSSSMSLDGAAFDKPQIGLAFDDRPGRPLDRVMRELYEREHYRPLVESGGIRLVRSVDELEKTIAEYLRDPALDRDARRKMLQDVCGDIGQAALSVSEMILRLLGHDAERLTSNSSGAAAQPA
jgi:hypothetical protein